MSISSSCVNKPMDCSLSNGLPFLTWSASTFSSASLSYLIWTFNRHWHTTGNKSPCSCIGAFAVKLDTFVDFLSARTGWLLCQNQSPCSYKWIFGFWLCLFGVFTTSSNFWTQFFHPIAFKEIFGGGRGDAYTFSYMISPVPIMIAFGIQQAGSVS